MTALSFQGRLHAIRRQLLDWYDARHRDLPWRRDRDPYRVWLSEVMLQQTRVDVVLPYFERFVARFPTLIALAGAAESEVLALWSGLGYYSRGRRLLQAARAILERHEGAFPTRPADVRRLPGVGEYTAGAVLSIALEQREPAVDGNVRRVLSRLAASDLDPTRGEGQRWVLQAASALVPMRRPGDHNQALMELGATVCTPRSPSCERCPLESLCEAALQGEPGAYPRGQTRSRSEDWLHVAALARNAAGQVLLHHRSEDEPILPRLWHLPGLFLPVAEADTAPRQLANFLRALLGRRVELGGLVAEARHQITYRRIRAAAYELRLERVPRTNESLRWSLDPRAEGLATSSLLGKLLRDAERPRQLPLV